MAKDPTNMTHADRMAALMRELGNPAAVSKADKLLELIGHEWLDVLGVREMAARRHGDSSEPPPMPGALQTQTTQKPEAESAGRTVSLLVGSYRTDIRSPYQNLRFSTRKHYDTLIKLILNDCGERKIADLKTSDIEALHTRWAEGGKFAIAKAAITMLRSLSYFGATTLEDRDCQNLSVILHRLKFAVVQTRSERLTAEQAFAICEMARKVNRPSVALAQAFQWDCNLRQKDVIGEWIPIVEESDIPSDVIDGNMKWVRGLRWENIDSDFVLRHTTSKDKKEVTIKLRETAPMVMAELRRHDDNRAAFPASGPILICESSELPWVPGEFRRWWRKIATKAGVPKAVKNMDSRERAPLRGSDMKRAEKIKAESLEANSDLLSISRH